MLQFSLRRLFKWMTVTAVIVFLCLHVRGMRLEWRVARFVGLGYDNYFAATIHWKHDEITSREYGVWYWSGTTESDWGCGLVPH
jgi:hypothetical protein